MTGVGVLFTGCLHGGDNGSEGDNNETDGTDSEDEQRNTGEDEEGAVTDGTPEETEDGRDTGDEGTEAGSGNESGTGERELDLREANVMDVSVEGGDGRYGFEVTLYHDDAGEEGYANWWQVESLEGELLGRRDLAHPHGTRRFTRSTTVDTGDETCVVVRGHDQTHGYGGRAIVVNVETDETNGFLQGEEPLEFSEEDCP